MEPRRPYQPPGVVGKPCPSCHTPNTQAEAWTAEGPFKCQKCGGGLKVIRQTSPNHKWYWETT